MFIFNLLLLIIIVVACVYMGVVCGCINSAGIWKLKDNFGQQVPNEAPYWLMAAPFCTLNNNEGGYGRVSRPS